MQSIDNIRGDVFKDEVCIWCHMVRLSLPIFIDPKYIHLVTINDVTMWIWSLKTLQNRILNITIFIFTNQTLWYTPENLNFTLDTSAAVSRPLFDFPLLGTGDELKLLKYRGGFKCRLFWLFFSTFQDNKVRLLVLLSPNDGSLCTTNQGQSFSYLYLLFFERNPLSASTSVYEEFFRNWKISNWRNGTVFSKDLSLAILIKVFPSYKMNYYFNFFYGCILYYFLLSGMKNSWQWKAKCILNPFNDYTNYCSMVT